MPILPSKTSLSQVVWCADAVVFSELHQEILHSLNQHVIVPFDLFYNFLSKMPPDHCSNSNQPGALCGPDLLRNTTSGRKAASLLRCLVKSLVLFHHQPCPAPLINMIFKIQVSNRVCLHISWSTEVLELSQKIIKHLMCGFFFLHLSCTALHQTTVCLFFKQTAVTFML